MKTELYGRKSFTVEAVKVTRENMEEVAAWCGGQIQTVTENGREKRFIKVEVKRALNENQTQAFCGDWVLKSDSGFKKYSHRAFVQSFEKQNFYTEIESVEQKDHPGEPTKSLNVFENAEELRVTDEPLPVDEVEAQTTREKLGLG